jgi:plastocyanin
MRSLFLASSCSSLVFVVVVTACSEDHVSASSAEHDAGAVSDGGSTTEGGHQGHDSAVVDAGQPPIRCTEAELAANDATDGGTLEITFERGANPKQYENRCATVKVGASVTFSGSFVQHPLEPAGGDSPNPIPYTAEDQPDDRLTVTMPMAGTFGYQCEFHPTLMFGAIRVVP